MEPDRLFGEGEKEGEKSTQDIDSVGGDILEIFARGDIVDIYCVTRLRRIIRIIT